jgi:Zn-dependent peptidase ImmA (M78 family)
MAKKRHENMPENMPAKITVGPLAYDLTTYGDAWVEHPKAEPAEMYGYTDHERGQILIHPNTTPQMRKVTTLHEVMHSVAFAAGQLDNRKRSEEDWVVMVAPLLLDTLKRNPALAAYLLAD